MNKEIRERVWNKFGCKCAYCGKELDYDKMQVDHVIPLYRNDVDETLKKWGIKRGEDNENNYFPSCARCNRWKGTYTIEEFRSQIYNSITQLHKRSPQYRLALDYGLINETKFYVFFWFEGFEGVKDV